MRSTRRARSGTSDDSRAAWPGWVLLSVGVHLALLAYLSCRTISHTKPDVRDPLHTRIRIRPEDADRLREFLERNNVNPLQEKVQALEQIAQEMAEERSQRLEMFQEFEALFSQRLDEAMAEALDGVIETLQAALAQETEAWETMRTVDRSALAESASATNLTALGPAVREVAEGLRKAKGHLGRAGHEFERAQARMSEASALVSWVADSEVTSLWASAVQEVTSAAAAGQTAASAVSHALDRDRRNYVAYTGAVSQIRGLENAAALKPAERKALERARTTAAQASSQLSADQGEAASVRSARETLAATLTRLQELRNTLPQRMAQAPLQRASPIEADSPKLPGLVSSNAAGMYQTALQLEDTIARYYRDARASELAILQALPLEDARSRIQVPRSQPPSVDVRALAGPVQSAQQLKAFEASFHAAHQHVAAILSAAMAMREMLSGAASEETRSGASSLEQMLEQTANLRRVHDLASELTGSVQDLAQAMQQILGGSPETAVPSSGPSAQTGSGGQSSRPSSGAGGPPAPRQIRGIPGRRVVAEGGRGAQWFYVAHWYIIGPFPNEGRRNIDTVFPPESVIDLDAVYTGKEGKSIRWEYVSSATPQITPPDMAEYAIYYAWTELEFDRDCDLWLAIGSDDRSDLWVNRLPIWRSSNVLKVWNPWEGFRRVHFRKGRNTILVRLENGWKGCAFSVLVYAGEGDSPPTRAVAPGGAG